MVITVDGFGSSYFTDQNDNPRSIGLDPLVGGGVPDSFGGGPPISYCREGEQKLWPNDANSSVPDSIWEADTHFDTPGSPHQELLPGTFGSDGAFFATNHYLMDQIVAAGGVALPYSYSSPATLSLIQSSRSAPSTPFFSFTGYSATTSQQQSVEKDIEYLRSEVDSINRFWRNSPIVILGHSGGGFIAEQYWEKENYRAKNVRLVVSFDSPINGTLGSFSCFPNLNAAACDAASFASGLSGDVLRDLGERWALQADFDTLILGRDVNQSYVAISTENDDTYDFKTQGLFDSIVPDSIFPCGVTLFPTDVNSCGPASPPSFVDGGIWRSYDPCEWTPALASAYTNLGDPSHFYALVCQQNADFVGRAARALTGIG